ncbi:MAG: 3,4-dihydroxy-2-butanone-4-phosphate synthase [Acidimicrobiales bacterium]
MIDPAARPADLARPGHIFPLRYSEGGVLKRAGHTEAAVAWPAWPGSTQPVCCARSCVPTRTRRCPTSSSSAASTTC